MGRALERIAEQAYVRAMNGKHLPLTKTWGRWEGRDREGAPILFIAAGGFSSGFQAAARMSGHPVTLWALKDLYGHRLR